MNLPKLKPNSIEAELDIFFQEQDIEENECLVDQKIKEREILDKEKGGDFEMN